MQHYNAHKILNLIFGLTVLLGGCRFYYEEKITLAPPSLVFYQAVHEKVFAPKCIACHGNSGGVNLESCKAVIQNLSMIEKVVFTTKTMPKNGSLTQAEAALLSTWIKAGAPESPSGAPATPSPTPTPEEPLLPTFTSLQKKIFNVRCVICHSPGGKAWGVPFLTYKDFFDPQREIVKPGNVEESGIMIAIMRDDEKRMPPPDTAGALKTEEIETIKKWIEDGAPEK